MGWNIGNSGETGLFVGGENIIRDNLIFYLDPGDYNCVPDGTGNDDEVTELALGDDGDITSDDDEINDIWTESDGAPCFQFDGSGDEYITFSPIDVSEFVTGNSNTAGAITSCVWFRTSHMDSGAEGGLLTIENYTYHIHFDSSQIQQFAADDDSGSHNEYTVVSVTPYNDDNWHFLVGVMNNTSSTIGDTSAAACAIYIDDMVTPVATSTFHASFQFRDTNTDLSIGIVDSNTWPYEGEIGPVMIYSDYCLSEEERIYNYNVHRHRYYDTAIG